MTFFRVISAALSCDHRWNNRPADNHIGVIDEDEQSNAWAIRARQVLAVSLCSRYADEMRIHAIACMNRAFMANAWYPIDHLVRILGFCDETALVAFLSSTFPSVAIRLAPGAVPAADSKDTVTATTSSVAAANSAESTVATDSAIQLTMKIINGKVCSPQVSRCHVIAYNVWSILSMGALCFSEFMQLCDNQAASPNRTKLPYRHLFNGLMLDQALRCTSIRPRPCLA